MSTEPLTFSESMQDGAWRISGLSLLLGLLLWGWFALTLSPIQRYYFSAYVGSSLHRMGSHEQDRAVWILKARPTNTFVVADPQDLVPAEHGPVPFALSKSAAGRGLDRNRCFALVRLSGRFAATVSPPGLLRRPESVGAAFTTVAAACGPACRMVCFCVLEAST